MRTPDFLLGLTLVPIHLAQGVAAVVRGVLYGLIKEEAALERYGLSVEEFHEWVRAVSQHGEAALKATALQKYRQP